MNSTLAKIVEFLDSVGVEKTIAVSSYDEEVPEAASNDMEEEVNEHAEELDAEIENVIPAEDNQDETHDVVTITSEDENDELDEDDDDRKPAAIPDAVISNDFDDDNDNIHAGHFGQVVQLDFLRQAPTNDDDDDNDEEMDLGGGLVWDDSKDLDSPTKRNRDVVVAQNPPADDGDSCLDNSDDFLEQDEAKTTQRRKRISPRSRQGDSVARKPTKERDYDDDDDDADVDDVDDENSADSASEDEDFVEETKTKYRKLGKNHTSPRTRKVGEKALTITIDDQSDDDETPSPKSSPKQGRRKSRIKKNRKDSYSRDGRLNKAKFYPSNDVELDYETDSDLAVKSNTPVKCEDYIELDDDSDAELPEPSPFASKPSPGNHPNHSMLDSDDEDTIKREPSISKST